MGLNTMTVLQSPISTCCQSKARGGQRRVFSLPPFRLSHPSVKVWLGSRSFRRRRGSLHADFKSRSKINLLIEKAGVTHQGKCLV